MSSLCVKFQPSSTPPSYRFWWGVLVVLVVFVIVTEVKQSPSLKTGIWQKKQAEAEVVPSSSLVEIGVEVEVEPGVEVEVGVEVGV